ncbi:hypothetical protein Tco_1016254 [Tanacetum coccineum]|uniref:non-specific serine/threonine protein kinase n=1 Tax=Tanacetum coccineum TaxID=301880 RepID=A0ABQ5FP51_9ASTR
MPSSKALKRLLLVDLWCVDPDAQKRLKMGHVLHMLEVDDCWFPTSLVEIIIGARCLLFVTANITLSDLAYPGNMIRCTRYIHFLIVELPSTLAYHVIDKFHTSRQKIHEILGIPMGETKLEDLNERPSNDPFIKEWKAQYNHLGKPTPPAIASRINSTKDTDFMFKMNFITLFGSTMGTLEMVEGYR